MTDYTEKILEEFNKELDVKDFYGKTYDESYGKYIKYKLLLANALEKAIEGARKEERERVVDATIRVNEKYHAIPTDFRQWFLEIIKVRDNL